MLRAFFGVLIVLAVAAWSPAQEANQKTLSDAQAVLDKAVGYLKAHQQEDGSWQQSGREPPALTAMVLRVFARDARTGTATPQAKKAIAYLLSVQQEDGGIYRDMLANYSTAICISGLLAVNDPAMKQPVEKAVAYLKGSQWHDTILGPTGEPVNVNPAFRGGWGYGGTRSRPDVSNTSAALDALKESGLKSDDPVFQNALKFVTRMQNFSETNPAPWAGNDGGFIYSAGKNGEGDSSAGEYTTADGRRMLRSYGSMTYAGLKSMIYAGLGKDDPRVQAAWNWIRNNWTLEENPAMSASGAENAKAGIYYYYYTLAKALAVYGEPVVVDRQQVAHDWRVELVAKLASVQKDDGTFVGDRKWMEDNPIIATSLAMLALEDAMQDLREHPAK